MDRLVLRGMVFFGRHGVHPAEKELGAHYRVDLELETDLRRAATTDDLGDTVDYGQLYEAVRKVVEGTPRNLVETVAEEIAAQALSMSAATRVRVRVAKPPPLAGQIEAFVVELERP